MPPRATRKVAAVAALLAAAVALPGCIIAAAIGGAAANAQRFGSTDILADYVGLEGKSYAVVVRADRLIQADHPGLIARITDRINRDIYENAGASNWIPTDRLIRFLLENPQWQAITPGELGELLGVERLIHVDLTEYALTEAGNPYLWDGTASGFVEVYEIDSGLPDDPMFDRAIMVRYPDFEGLLTEELPRAAVTSELSRRFAQRVSWLFYDHEEPNELPY